MASEDPLDPIERWIGTEQLPEDYRSVLAGMVEEWPVGEGGLLYTAAHLVERNETFESRLYCPGHFIIGSDGGGRAIVVEYATGAILIVDHGTMTPDCMEGVAPSFAAWHASGFTIPGEGAEEGAEVEC